MTMIKAPYKQADWNIQAQYKTDDWYIVTYNHLDESMIWDLTYAWIGSSFWVWSSLWVMWNSWNVKDINWNWLRKDWKIQWTKAQELLNKGLWSHVD